jgi:hypothetical protein
VRFQILTATSMKMTVFWDVAPCSLVDNDRRYRGAYCLHHQGQFLPGYTAHHLLNIYSIIIKYDVITCRSASWENIPQIDSRSSEVHVKSFSGKTRRPSPTERSSAVRHVRNACSLILWGEVVVVTKQRNTEVIRTNWIAGNYSWVFWSALQNWLLRR